MSVLVQAVVFVIASAMAIQSVFYLKEPIVTSPGILPLLVALAVAVIAGGLLIADILKGVVSLTSVRRFFSVPENGTKALRAASWLGLSSIYALATPVVGFTSATLAFLTIALTMFAKLVWWKTAVIAVAIATVVPFVFRYVFFAIVP